MGLCNVSVTSPVESQTKRKKKKKKNQNYTTKNLKHMVMKTSLSVDPSIVSHVIIIATVFFLKIKQLWIIYSILQILLFAYKSLSSEFHLQEFQKLL